MFKSAALTAYISDVYHSKKTFWQALRHILPLAAVIVHMLIVYRGRGNIM